MKKLLLILCITGLTLFSSCGEETAPLTGDYSYKIRMTDAPAPYTAINVDILGVSIVDGKGQTVNLSTNAGVHNLLQLTNGADMLLGNTYLNNNEIRQIKLNLGTNNTLVANGQTYPLSLSNEDKQGLTITISQMLEENANNEILLDFDANSSVIATGENTYKLRPVIRTVDTSITGSISGTIDNTSMAVISAVSSSNVSYTTGVDANGNFKVQGLPTGSYTLTITPILPATPFSKTNIPVQAGQDTSISTILF